MFTAEELQAIDTEYFRMIVMDPYDLTIQSKCTGHYLLSVKSGVPLSVRLGKGNISRFFRGRHII